jgi:hypothetical protein
VPADPRRRASSLRALRAILAKDLRVELRALQSVPAMALFAITTFVLFRYGLDRESLSGGLAAGVLLATVLFAAILAINRLFVAERDEGGFDAIRLAPVDGTALLGAKAAALVIYLLLLELIAVPACRRWPACSCWPTSDSPRRASSCPPSRRTPGPGTCWSHSSCCRSSCRS